MVFRLDKWVYRVYHFVQLKHLHYYIKFDESFGYLSMLIYPVNSPSHLSNIYVTFVVAYSQTFIVSLFLSDRPQSWGWLSWQRSGDLVFKFSNSYHLTVISCQFESYSELSSFYKTHTKLNYAAVTDLAAAIIIIEMAMVWMTKLVWARGRTGCLLVYFTRYIIDREGRALLVTYGWVGSIIHLNSWFWRFAAGYFFLWSILYLK